MKEFPAYYGILPACVRYDNTIPPMARIMYAEVSALSNQYGFCSAGNKYFADLYGVTTVTVSRWFSQMEKAGHIYIEADPVSGHNRKVYPLNKNVKAPYQKDQGPLNKNVKHNNTSIILRDNTHTTLRANEAETDPVDVSKKNQEVFRRAAEIAKEAEARHLGKITDEELKPVAKPTTPDWKEVAQAMADYFKGEGSDEWKFHCAAVRVNSENDPLQVCAAWAGKASPYELNNWQDYTRKLSTWIERAYRKPQPTIKLNNGTNQETTGRRTTDATVVEAAEIVMQRRAARKAAFGL